MEHTKSTATCSASVITTLLEQGVEAALLAYPELVPQRPLLEKIHQLDELTTHHERMAADGARRLDELGGELEAAVSAIQS
jgi:hypothetical protein